MPGKEQLSAKEQHEIYTNLSESEEFTEKQLKDKWQEYVKQVSGSGNLKSTLSNIPKLADDYKLILSIENSVQEEAVKSIKPELVSWLRRELKNSKIDIITKIEERKEGRVIYTDTDKYQEMLKKNPDLELLRQTFKLNFGD